MDAPGDDGGGGPPAVGAGLLPDEPVLATSAIQGNIVPGFATDDLALVGLTLLPDADVAVAGRFLAALAPTGHERVRCPRPSRAGTPTRRRPPRLQTDETWLNVALSHAILRRLGLPDFRDPSFREGLSAAAARRLGDPPARAAAVAAGAAGPIDVLFIVAAADAAATARAAGALRDEAIGHGFVPTVRGARPPAASGHRALRLRRRRLPARPSSGGRRPTRTGR